MTSLCLQSNPTVSTVFDGFENVLKLAVLLIVTVQILVELFLVSTAASPPHLIDTISTVLKQRIQDPLLDIASLRGRNL